MVVINVDSIGHTIQDKPFFISILYLIHARYGRRFSFFPPTSNEQAYDERVFVCECVWVAYTISILSGSDTHRCLHINDDFKWNGDRCKNIVVDDGETMAPNRCTTKIQNFHGLYALHLLSFRFVGFFPLFLHYINWLALHPNFLEISLIDIINIFHGNCIKNA